VPPVTPAVIHIKSFSGFLFKILINYISMT